MTTFACLTLCALGLGEPAELQEVRTATYSIRPLLIGQDLGLTLTGLPRFRSDTSEEVTDRTGLGRVVAGDVQEVLFLLLDLFPDLVSADTFLTLTGDDRLVVRGSEALHGRMAEALAGLERTVGHRSRLDVSILRGGAGAFAGLPSEATLDADEAARWIAGAESVDAYALQLNVGGTSLLDQSGTRAVLYDYSVEIASASGVFDPEMLLVRDGTRLAARYVPRGDGGRLALLVDRCDALGELDVLAFTTTNAITTGEDGGGVDRTTTELELERLETLSRGLALDLDLAAGEVAAARLAWNLGDASGEELVLASVEADRLGAIEVVPVGEAALVMVDREAIEGGYAFVQRPDRAYLQGHSWAQRRTPLDLVIRRSGPTLEFELLPRVPSGWRTVGNWLVAGVESPAAARAVAAEVEPLLLAPSTARRVAAQGFGAGDGDPRVAVELPAPLDGQAFAYVVRTTPRLTDFDVEIATRSMIGDPVVSDLEQGMAVGLVPRLAAGSASIGVRGEFQQQAGSTRIRDWAALPGGTIEAIDLEALRVDQVLTLEGSRARIGSGTGPRIRVQLR